VHTADKAKEVRGSIGHQARKRAKKPLSRQFGSEGQVPLL